jgi:altronate hydrolase
MSRREGEVLTPLTVPPRHPVELAQIAVKLHPDDDVAIVKAMVSNGTTVTTEDGPINIGQAIPPGHKVALTIRDPGEPVRRYGQIIGFATSTISPGEHVHTHNLAVAAGAVAPDYAMSTEYRPTEFLPERDRRTFMGIRRRDGRVGTRNYVAVLASVNCSSSAAEQIVQVVRASGVLAEYPNVDDVIAFATKGGCGAHYGSPNLKQFQRTLTGMVDHPNVGAYLLLSLGCEDNQPDDMVELGDLTHDRDSPQVLTIQQQGGFRRTVEEGIEALNGLLPIANNVTREPVPAAELVLALQCGGSDSWSGVTANPALGWASDQIVRNGGTIVLGETPEVYGAEHLLTRRARCAEVAEKLIERIHWWEAHTGMFGASIDNNPAPGNKAGGLTTIYEKSLGAIAKAGSTSLNDVVLYAERISERGFVHMDTPGYDPVSVTGQVAGGCNIVAFTTGRGSCFGYKPSPSLKIASTSTLYQSQQEDMDINAGTILEGATIADVGEAIFEELLAVASGKQTKSELAGIGEQEFIPWPLGVTL